MRRKDKEISDINEIEGVIKRAGICRLGLVDGNKPYIIPLNFGYENRTLYFHWALQGRKVDIIKKNNRVCFEIDIDVKPIIVKKTCGGRYCANKYRSVIGTGRARILEDDKEKAHALSVMTRHYYNTIMRPCSECDCDFSKSALHSILMVRIDVDDITGKKSGY